MGRVKKCRICGETLFCQKCGTRQSPEVPDRKKFTMLLTEKERDILAEKAAMAGVSVAAYIKKNLKL